MTGQKLTKKLWGYLDRKLETAQTGLASGFWFVLVCILIAPRVLIAAVKIGAMYLRPGKSTQVVPILAVLNANAALLCDF